MLVFVNGNNEIQAVGSTEDPTLTELYIDETREDYPFTGWSEAKIKCVKVTVDEEGMVTMWTPYRPSSTLDYIDEIGHDSDNKTEALKILFGEEE